MGLAPLTEWNRTKALCPAVCIHAFFEQQAEEAPDIIAACFKEHQLTYRELKTSGLTS